MTDLRLVTDDEQIQAIDDAVADGALIMSVRIGSPNSEVIFATIRFMHPATGEEVYWNCGLSAARHAQTIMDAT